MDKIVYVRDWDGELESEGINVKEAKRIEFDLPSDMDIEMFWIVCRRMAAALGYHTNSIVQQFGEEDIEDDRGYDALLKAIIKNDNVDGEKLSKVVMGDKNESDEESL